MYVEVVVVGGVVCFVVDVVGELVVEVVVG